MRSTPGGYTLGIIGGFNAVNATLYDKLPVRCSAATSRRLLASALMPNVMEVPPSFPASTVPEFIAYAKANPDKINFASEAASARQRT